MAEGNEPVAGYIAWKDWGDEQFGHCPRSDARVFAWQLARCHPTPVRNALELGFGNGNFMGFGRSRGIAMTGIETQPELRRRASATGYETFASIDELDADRRFDLIAAFDVFEHIAQDRLIALFRALAARLQPDGVLLCRVPNGESPFGRVFQHGDLTHLSTLGLSKFRQICAASDLTITFYGDAPWHVVGRNVKGMMRLALKWLIERSLAFVYRLDARALSPNMVIAFKKLDAGARAASTPSTPP